MLAVNDSIITNEKKIASILNDHYINIVEKSSGIKPNQIVISEIENVEKTILNIIDKYKNHPSIIKITESNCCCEVLHSFNFNKLMKKRLSLYAFKALDCATSNYCLSFTCHLLHLDQIVVCGECTANCSNLFFFCFFCTNSSWFLATNSNELIVSSIFFCCCCCLLFADVDTRPPLRRCDTVGWLI